MKYIKKTEEPTEFTEWKGRANEKRSYKNLGNPTKSIVKQALIEEQGYICCYCEQELIETDSHIEHFLPQTSYPEKDIEFSNMLCSCQNQIKKGEPRHCGNLKADQELAISPFNEKLMEFVSGYLKKVDGKYQPFYTTVKFLFEAKLD